MPTDEQIAAALVNTVTKTRGNVAATLAAMLQSPFQDAENAIARALAPPKFLDEDEDSGTLELFAIAQMKKARVARDAAKAKADQQNTKRSNGPT